MRSTSTCVRSIICVICTKQKCEPQVRFVRLIIAFGLVVVIGRYKLEWHIGFETTAHNLRVSYYIYLACN